MRDRVAICCRINSRPRALAFVSLVVLGGCGGAPQDPVTVETHELTLRGVEQPEFRKTLEPGTWLVEVHERGIDVRVFIESAGVQADMRDPLTRQGFFYQVVSASAPAPLLVRVRSDDHVAWRGAVTVRLARFQRDADAAAGPSESAYRAWAGAGVQQAAGTPESWARAADLLNEAVSQFGKAGDDRAQADAAYTLASLQQSPREDLPAAIRAAEQAADLFEDLDDPTGVQDANALRAAAELSAAAALNATTQRAEQKTLYDTADARLAGAAAYFESHALPLRAAYAYNLRGIRALNLGDDDAAAAHFSRALKLSTAEGDVSGQIYAKVNLAWSLRLQGFVAKAAEEYAALLPLIDADQQSYLYGVVLNNLGFCLIALGEFDRALTLHTEALELFTRLGEKEERATQLAALGALYFRVGDTQRALETLRAAMAAQESVSDTGGLARTLRVAGNASSAAGQHDMALEYLRRSAGIDANPHEVSRTRVLIAGELRTLGDHGGAAAELEAALTSPVALVRAEATAERARLRQARKDLAGAITDLRAADRMYADLGLDFNRIETTSSLSQLLLANRDADGASAAADESVKIVQRIRFHSSNPEWRARFLSAQYAPFEARIAVDLARHRPGDTAGLWEAFRTADAVRARSLADQIADVHAGARENDAEVGRLRDMLTDQQLRLESRIQSQDEDAAGTLALRREIEENRARLDALRAKHGGGSASESRLPEALRRVQEQLPPDTVVLAYFVGDASSHAWLLAKNRLRHSRLAGRELLQQAIDATAEHRPGSPGARGADLRLSAMLFGDLLDGTQEHRALVIPDGPLNGVPFSSLPVNGTGTELLLDRFLVGYAPSLALALAPPEKTKAAGRRVAVISDPVYAPDDRRLASAGAGNLRGARQASPNKLTRLPYSALEAKSVMANFSDHTTISLSGFDATPEKVEQLAATDLEVLHFAAHAVARKDSPERSALFLSEYDTAGTLRPDSQFTANDVRRSGLKAELVVLSGCATGDGSTLRGEGVLGLTYGFLANGSGAVVASLWPVEDASTARFMNEFYRAYRAGGNAAEALRAAQRRSRANPADAAVWSSFVVRANGFP